VVSGVATFTALSINKTGTGYTLSATSTPAYTSATSAAFNIIPGAPTQLAFLQGPSSAIAGADITPAVTVAVEDAFGNVETGDITTTVGLAIGTNPGGGTLTGGTAVAVVGGIATFTGLWINKVGTGYTLSATSTPAYTSATSSAFNITVGAPTQLAYVQGPSNVVAGADIIPAVTVAVEDAFGNVETGDNATTIGLAIASNPGGGTLTGGTAVAVVAGVATFAGLWINKTGTGYTLTATSTPSRTAATSAAFNVTPGAPTQLAFLQGPSNAKAGVDLSPAVTVAVEDAFGNVETGDKATTISLAIATNPGGGSLIGGSAITVSAGVATFAGLWIDKVGTGYTLAASSTPAYTSATSSAFNISPGVATQLVFGQGPTTVVAGVHISPAVTVAVEDAFGNVETADNATTVGLAIGTNPGGGTLTGGTAVAVSAGIATFPGLWINKTGTGYTLTASSTPTLAGATSAGFNVTPGPPTQLAFIEGPSNAPAGLAISPAVTVAVEDVFGNVETGDNATTIGLALGANPGNGTLYGGKSVTVVAGIATFSGMAITKVGTGYTLTASSAPTYTAATSAPFNVTPGTATQLVFIQGPSNATAGATITPAVTVAIEDAYGNVETADNTTTVGLIILTNPGKGTLTGGSVVASSGIATFTALSINKTGTGYTLMASSTPTLNTAISSSFNITVGPPTQLGYIQGPSDTNAGADMTPVVTVAVEDAYGNVETPDNSTQVTLTIGTNPGGGTLGGGSATTVSSGVATFAGLSISAMGTGYTLTATSTPVYTAAASSPFTIKPGALGLSCAPPPTPSPLTQCQSINLPATTLDGLSQMTQAGNTFYVTDQRGLLNVGWSVTAKLIPTPSNPNPSCANVATFCDASAGASATHPQGQIPAPHLSVGNITCTPVSGNPNPNAQPGPGGTFPSGAGAVSLCTAPAGQSAGTFKLGATYSLELPEGIYAGKYQATVEYLAF
jgi:hypothetical protein